MDVFASQTKTTGPNKMVLYKVQLTPQSKFATSVRGDTLFGQLCWGMVHRYGSQRLSELLDQYDRAPFAVVSDGFAPGYLPKPSLPGYLLGESAETKKLNRKKHWLTPEDLHQGRFDQAKTDAEVGFRDDMALVTHNSINYLSFRTDGDMFSPYGSVESVISTREVYWLIDETQVDIDQIWSAMDAVGQMGYGKEASIGKGRFVLSEPTPTHLPIEGNTFVALSPISIEETDAVQVWYEPFTRFGKHGDSRARKAPFKRPVLMADTGAVLQMDQRRSLMFAGKALRNVSTLYPDTVHQGYAIMTSMEGKQWDR